jgi:adenosylcobinamide kinase/adenosylcobinamide-phosphate guanylyltransferase
MSAVTLITGGARSGKSAYGEDLALRLGGMAVLYVATATATDPEMARRIRTHRARRPAQWATEERSEGFASLGASAHFRNAGAVLLDCIGFALNNALYSRLSDWDHPDPAELQAAEDAVSSDLRDLITLCRQEGKELILITNEVGDGLVPESLVSRMYRDALGRINCLAASLADRAVLMTCGLPLTLKEPK